MITIRIPQGDMGSAGRAGLVSSYRREKKGSKNKKPLSVGVGKGRVVGVLFDNLRFYSYQSVSHYIKSVVNAEPKFSAFIHYFDEFINGGMCKFFFLF